MLRIPDTDSIRNPEAYLFTVANNLLREHGVQERRLNTQSTLMIARTRGADLTSPGMDR